ncbi:glycosyltransferase family 4 protein [Endozoicomonas sp. SCSIO W0465]|uniref:glycosyltransferase family 4 protein n=1 Tax=Endozoicomonas sp. SCSIO W0465 TaxID=2918516 RepID=UPI0020765764|nr:glycosyltransferase family 4 protein [Endozoicomonas sp. SCSIO W0465]USE37495.1 glycosyltransferase family 4 protein [Endozoicomonas sp. SCSIO W0465]
MIKLAIVRQKYRPDGGAERFVASALSALSQQKAEQQPLDITVLTRQWQGIKNPSFHVEVCNPFKWGRVSRERGFARAAQKHFSSFDIVQSHERIPGCTIYRAGDGVHKCWLEHRSRIIPEAQAKRMKNDRFHRYVMDAEKQMFEHPKLRAVICNSQMVKVEVCREFAINPEIVHVIYNSVNQEKFNPALKQAEGLAVREALGIEADATAMLFVGSGFERKGLAATLEAIAATKAHLIVVGKDKQEEKYQQQARDLGCAEHVHFMGMQNDSSRFYGAADGFILPTIYDPFPNVILEAMASGLGVITSTSCGGAEIIEEGQNGYCCDALEIPALSSAINAFTDKGHAASLGMMARETIKPFTSERLTSQLLSLYSQILNT